MDVDLLVGCDAADEQVTVEVPLKYRYRRDHSMLKVGRLADYGVLILHHLGRVRPVRLSMESIAELTRLPLPTVRKVMKYLVDAELVVSKRGPNGGYQLARPPEKVNLAEAIAAVEGTLALTECCDAAGSCEIVDHCDLAGRWPGVNAIVMRVLERTSLADLDRFGRHEQHIPPPLRELMGSPPARSGSSS